MLGDFRQNTINLMVNCCYELHLCYKIFKVEVEGGTAMMC